MPDSPPDSKTGEETPDDLDRDGRILLQRVAQNDMQAFETLYDSYHRPLYALVLRMVHDRSTADDVVQNAFLKVWERASSYDPKGGRPISWLLTVARNTSLDHLRAHGRREKAVNRAMEDQAVSIAPTEPGTLDRILGEESAARVRGALSKLQPDQRVALDLAYFAGLSQTEIASKLGEPLGTVKSRIRRGLASLKEVLNIEGERGQYHGE